MKVQVFDALGHSVAAVKKVVWYKNSHSVYDDSGNFPVVVVSQASMVVAGLIGGVHAYVDLYSDALCTDANHVSGSSIRIPV